MSKNLKTLRRMQWLALLLIAAPATAGLTVDALKAFAAKRVALVNDDPAFWSPDRQACAAMTPGPNTTVGNFQGFQAWAAGSEWRRNITADPADPSSDTWLLSMGSDQGIALGNTAPIHATDLWNSGWYGHPYAIVSGSQAKIDISQDLAGVPAIAAIDPEGYPGNSDPGPFPIPFPPIIQGTHGPGTNVNYLVPGDKHLYIIDKDLCFEHEFWNTYYYNGKIYAGTVATFDLLGGDHQRPWGWSSTSVSGVPQFAGIIRYDEVAAGRVDHALAFTALQGWGRAAFTDAATEHQWNNSNDPALPPFGARLRLKAGFDISGFGPQTRAVLQALKTYGAIYVDGGHPVDLYYSTDDRWDWLDISQITQVKVTPADFDFIQTGPIYSYRVNEPRPPAGAAPAIDFVEVYPPTIAAGEPAIVYWSGSGESLRFLSTVGALRTNWAIVTPNTTTTYTLRLQNKDGVVTQDVTLNVTPAPEPGSASISQAGLDHVQVFPNPWRQDRHDRAPISISNLTGKATIKIFDVAGRLVREHQTTQSRWDWDRLSDRGRSTASGIYLLLITNDAGAQVRRKVAIIR